MINVDEPDRLDSVLGSLFTLVDDGIISLGRIFWVLIDDDEVDDDDKDVVLE